MSARLVSPRGLHTSPWDMENAVKSAIQQYIASNRVDATARDLTRLYATSTTVGACADLRADMVSQIPMKVQNKHGEVEPDHPLYRIFMGRYSFSNLMRRSELAMSFWGRNLLNKRRNVFRVPVRLDWVNPNVYSTDVLGSELRGFRIFAGSRYQVEPVSYLEPRDALYMHGVDFDDDFDGVSEVERAFLEASIEPEKAQTLLSVFRNMAFLGGIAQPASDTNYKIEDVDKNNLVAYFRRAVQGAVNAGKFLVSPKRWEWISLQTPLRELDMNPIAGEVRLAVCIAFRIPMELIVPSAANYAQFEGARRTWGHTWLVPRVEWYADVFTEQLAQEFGDEWRVVPDLGAIPFLKEDAKSLVEVVNAKVSGSLLSLYDAQKALGDEPDEALKDLYMVNSTPVPKTELASYWRSQIPTLQPVDPGSAIPTDAGSQPVSDDPATANLSSAAAQPDTRSLCVMFDLANNPDLLGLQNRLKTLYADESVEWTPPADLHLTCIVAPSVTTEQVAALQAALAEVEVPALRLVLGSLGSFDNVAEHALHFRIRRNAALLDFQAELYDLCLELGIPIGSHSLPANYKPHVTMGYGQTHHAVTVNNKIAVQPTSLLLSIKDDQEQRVVWRSEPASPDIADGEVPVKFGGKSAERSLLPDAQWKELTDWQRLAERKGTDYAFKSAALPAVVSAYIRLALDDGEGMNDVFVEGRAFADALAAKSYADTRAAFVAEMLNAIGAAQKDAVSRQKFGGSMRAAIRRYGLMAFRDGMEAEGYSPESFGAEELAAFRAWQDETSGYISAFGEELFKQGGITEAEIAVRAEMWANQSLESVRELGMFIAAPEALYEWVEGDTSDKCRDCLRLNGQVHSMREWRESGYTPTTGKTECGSFNCHCRLVRTNKPRQGEF